MRSADRGGGEVGKAQASAVEIQRKRVTSDGLALDEGEAVSALEGGDLAVREEGLNSGFWVSPLMACGGRQPRARGLVGGGAKGLLINTKMKSVGSQLLVRVWILQMMAAESSTLTWLRLCQAASRWKLLTGWSWGGDVAVDLSDGSHFV